MFHMEFAELMYLLNPEPSHSHRVSGVHVNHLFSKFHSESGKIQTHPKSTIAEFASALLNLCALSFVETTSGRVEIQT